MFKRLFILLIFFSELAHGAPMTDDLRWLINAIEFSNLRSDQLDKFMDPGMGKEEYRLTKRFAPWAGNYFAMEKGGIAARWQLQGARSTELYSKEKLLKMTPKQISKLSPIEKYDLFMGDYEFSATKHELANRGPNRNPAPEYWEGFCNGVRCAGVIQPEPVQAVTLKNADGIEIRFEPNDIKALLGASYFYVEKYSQIGSPTRSGLAADQPNPAVFDLAVRYHLGFLRKGFIIDSHLGEEIWNETVVGYKREVLESADISVEEGQRHPNAIRRLRIKMTLESLGEVDLDKTNKSTKHEVAGGKYLSPVISVYDLFIDQNNRVIEGEWFTSGVGSRGVDFAWFARGKGADDLYANVGGNPFLIFRNIKKIMKGSSQFRCESVLLPPLKIFR